MKTLAIVIFSLLSLCALAEPRSTPSPATPKSKAAEQVTKDFFTYLLTPKRNIATDADAQTRWLTKSLRELLVSAVTTANKIQEERGKDYNGNHPDNGTFLSAWDAPTSFEITQSQHTPYLALVAARFRWGPRTDYPGDQRTMTAILAYEDEAWRISDIHTHPNKFVERVTVIELLNKCLRQ